MLTIPSGAFLRPDICCVFRPDLCAIDIARITDADAVDLHSLRRVAARLQGCAVWNPACARLYFVQAYMAEHFPGRGNTDIARIS